MIEESISAIESQLPDDATYKRKLSILLLLNDSYLFDYLKKPYGDKLVNQLSEKVRKTRRQFKGNINWLVIVLGKECR